MEELLEKNEFERSLLWITFSVIFVRGKKVLFDGHFRQNSLLYLPIVLKFVAMSTISFESISNHYYLSQIHNIEMTFYLYFNKKDFFVTLFWRFRDFVIEIVPMVQLRTTFAELGAVWQKRIVKENGGWRKKEFKNNGRQNLYLQGAPPFWGQLR